MRGCNIYSLNTLNKNDFQRLYLIYKKTFVLSPWEKSYFFSFLQNKNRHPLGVFLKKDGRIIGFAFGRITKKDPVLLNLAALWVEKNHRKKGLGKLLVKKFTASAYRKKSLRKAFLHFRKSNRLQYFYEACGFSGVKVDGKYSNGEYKYYMDIRLK